MAPPPLKFPLTINELHKTVAVMHKCHDEASKLLLTETFHKKAPRLVCQYVETQQNSL